MKTKIKKNKPKSPKSFINNSQSNVAYVHMLLRKSAENNETVQLNFNRGFVIGLIKLTAIPEIFSIDSKSCQIRFYANEVLDMYLSKDSQVNSTITLTQTTPF